MKTKPKNHLTHLWEGMDDEERNQFQEWLKTEWINDPGCSEKEKAKIREMYGIH